MGFVPVRVAAPNGKVYRVEIDDSADASAVTKSLVRGIGLDEAKPYRLALVDALALEPNVTLELRELEPPAPIRRLAVEDDDE